MKEEIIKNLSGIIDYVKQGADFIKEQAPLYVQELINYGIWTSVFETLLYFSLFVFAIYLIVKTYKYAKREEEDLVEYAPIFLLLLVIAGIMFVLTAISFETFIQTIAAPRVYVVEKLLTICK